MASSFAVLMMAGVLAPLGFLACMRPSSLGEWMLVSGGALAVIGFAVIAGPWVFLSLHVRPAALHALNGWLTGAMNPSASTLRFDAAGYRARSIGP